MQAPSQPVRKDGLIIYYGVLPAALLAEQEPASAKHMQPGKAAGGDSHHLVVALFEEATGKRLSDVSVQARGGDAADFDRKRSVR